LAWAEKFLKKDHPMARHGDNNQDGEKRGKAMRGRAGRMQGGRGSGRSNKGPVRLWGRHAVEAALKNPNRMHRKLWATREGIASLDGELPEGFNVDYCQPVDLGRLVAKDAPHQGLVLECEPLEDIFLDDVLDEDPSPDRGAGSGDRSA
jgi:23S rRNA (guanosine2251-2'-O)-methyltransferase